MVAAIQDCKETSYSLSRPTNSDLHGRLNNLPFVQNLCSVVAARAATSGFERMCWISTEILFHFIRNTRPDLLYFTVMLHE